MRWMKRTVCVEHHRSDDGNVWRTSTSVDRMDTLPNMRMVYKRTSCVAAGYTQVIHVYEEKFRKADGTCDSSVIAATARWDTTNGLDYDGYISRARIRLNDCWVKRSTMTPHRKLAVNNHELMHAIGLRHDSVRCPSVIGSGCSDYAWPQKNDKDKVRVWYA